MLGPHWTAYWAGNGQWALESFLPFCWCDFFRSVSCSLFKKNAHHSFLSQVDLFIYCGRAGSCWSALAFLWFWRVGASWYGGFSRGAQARQCMHFSSCGTWAWLLQGRWDHSGPGLKPVSPPLAGGFLAAGPPGKSSHSLLFLASSI